MSAQESQVETQEQPCQCQAYLRATEHAALVSARWLGRADEHAAEEAAAKNQAAAEANRAATTAAAASLGVTYGRALHVHDVSKSRPASHLLLRSAVDETFIYPNGQGLCRGSVRRGSPASCP